MKKIIALLLVFAGLLNIPAVSLAEENEKTAVDYSKYIRFVQSVGIMPDDVIEVNKTVTRGQFADYVNNILFNSGEESKAETWFEGIFEEENYDQLIIPSGNAGYFDDVAESHMYYDSVRRVKEYLVMNGTGNRTFAPDREITFGEVAIATVRMLGYEVMSQNSTHASVALDLGVFEGLTFEEKRVIKMGELARVFYNISDIELMGIGVEDGTVNYGVENDLTLLEKFMSIYRKKGQITKNPYASIDGSHGVGDGKIEIDYRVYDFGEAEYAIDYIGREVEYWYFEDEDSVRPELILAELTDKDEVLKVSAENVYGFSDYTFSYEENGKIKRENVLPGSVVIYNGVNKQEYLAEDFDFENGDITLIKPKTSKDYNIIIVNNYVTCFVTDVNEKDNKIYAKNTPDSAVMSINTFAGTEDAYKVRVFDVNGVRASVDSVSAGKVYDIAKNGDVVKMIISEKASKNILIKSIGVDDEEIIVTDAENNVYNFLPSLYNSLGYRKPKINEAYTVYFNTFGEIAWIENYDDASDNRIFYVLKSVDSDEENRAYIKLLNSKGKISMYQVAENVALNKADGTKLKLREGVSFSGVMESYTGAAVIEFDENNIVKSITLPMSVNAERSNRFGMFLKNEKAICCGLGSEKFFENAMLSSDIVIYNVDETAVNEEDRFTVVNSSRFVDGSGYDIIAYNFNSESVVADCIVVKGKVKSTVDNSSATMYIINKIETSVDDEDNVVTRLKCDAISSTKNIEKIDLICEEGKEATAVTFFNEKKEIELKKGDIIYCELDENVIKNAKLVYRIFASDGESKLYGTSGSYTPADGDNTNPYVITESRTLQTSNINQLRNGRFRFFAGNAKSIEANRYLTYTSEPLRDGKYDKTKSNNRYLTETVVLPSKYVVVEVSGKNITVKNASLSDIKTFDNAGTGFSELFLLTRYAVVRQLVVVNYIN